MVSKNGLVETDELCSATDNYTDKYLQKLKRKKNNQLSSNIDFGRELGFDETENHRLKKSKKRKKYSFSNVENDFDILEELEFAKNLHEKSCKKKRPNKLKLDDTEKESNNLCATSQTRTNSPAINSHHENSENCCEETNFVTGIIITDKASIDTVDNSVVMSSLHIHNEESPWRKKAECTLEKVRSDEASMQPILTYQNDFFTPEFDSTMAPLLNAVEKKSSSVSNGHLFGVTFDTVLPVDKEKPGRKRRRTRRRKSKFASNACMKLKANDEMVYIDQPETCFSAEQKKGRQNPQDSLLPTQTNVRIIFKESENSTYDTLDEGANSCMNSYSSDRLEGTAVSISDNKYANTNDPTAALIHMANHDQTMLTKGDFRCEFDQSLSISGISATFEPSASELSSISKLITESELSMKTHVRANKSKKDSPFANVQVFCRQKFKKMPSVSWDSCSQTTLSSDAKKPCSNTESQKCSNSPKPGADNSFTVKLLPSF
jgi:hypothetical protein